MSDAAAPAFSIGRDKRCKLPFTLNSSLIVNKSKSVEVDAIVKFSLIKTERDGFALIFLD